MASRLFGGRGGVHSSVYADADAANEVDDRQQVSLTASACKCGSLLIDRLVERVRARSCRPRSWVLLSYAPGDTFI